MRNGRAFWLGVIGGAAVTVLLTLGRMVGIPANIGMMLGTVTGLAPTPGTWLLGFVMHLVISGLIGLVYAAVFEYVLHQSGSAAGLGVAIIHSIVAGLFMGLVPIINPAIPAILPAPGLFLSNLGGAGVVLFFVVHLIYGWIVGAWYGPVLHPTTERRQVHAH